MSSKSLEWTAEEKAAVVKPGVASLALVATVFAIGCGPARSASDVTRDVARGAVLVVVEASDVADVACASIASRALDSSDTTVVRRAMALAGRCARGKDAVVASAKAMRSTLRAWDAAAAGHLACAAARALAGLTEIRDAVQLGGGDVPEVVDDAVERARFLAGLGGATCEVQP